MQSSVGITFVPGVPANVSIAGIVFCPFTPAEGRIVVHVAWPDGTASGLVATFFRAEHAIMAVD